MLYLAQSQEHTKLPSVPNTISGEQTLILECSTSSCMHLKASLSLDVSFRTLLNILITYLHFEKLWSSTKQDLNCNLLQVETKKLINSNKHAKKILKLR